MCAGHVSNMRSHKSDVNQSTTQVMGVKACWIHADVSPPAVIWIMSRNLDPGLHKGTLLHLNEAMKAGSMLPPDSAVSSYSPLGAKNTCFSFCFNCFTVGFLIFGTAELFFLVGQQPTTFTLMALCHVCHPPANLTQTTYSTSQASILKSQISKLIPHASRSLKA